MTGKALLYLGILVIAAVLAGFYIQSRELETAKVSTISSLSQIQDITPTECSYSVGSYGTGSGGTMYIENNELRVSIEDLELSDFAGTMQAVLGLDGTRLMDPATVRAGNGVSNAERALNTVITSAPWRCSVWWFPDSSLFRLAGADSF